MAATSFVKLGIKAKIYRNTGTYGSPTWTHLALVRDCTVNAPWDIVDASTRSHRVKLNAKTMMGLTIGISMRKDDLDAGAVAILAAAMEDTVIDMLILDGPITTEGSTGYRSHFIVNPTGEDQGPGAALYPTYDLLPAYSSEGDPKYITVGSASALTPSDPG
jgi:hypothetical protein